MFSTKALTDESFPIAILRKETGKKALETIYYTEPSRKLRKPPTDFAKSMEEYVEPAKDYPGEYRLQPGYLFEMVPTVTAEGTTHPRFINFYLSTSNSGKSYQIANLCKHYKKMFPHDLIAYASANPIANDTNYSSDPELLEHIKEVDVINLESTIDFSNPDYKNSLWIFDDCDSGFSANMQDLDSRLTQEELDKLSVTEKQKALRMLKAKTEMASIWLNKSIIAFMKNGRKMNQSLAIVSHKPFSGVFENEVINEATGVVLFPASIQKGVLFRLMTEKMSISKAEAKALLERDWYRYDYLYLSHRTSHPFAMGLDFLKFL